MSDTVHDGREQDEAAEATAVPRPPADADADAEAETGMAAPESGAD